VENRQKNLTARQTLVFSWDARTQWYTARVESVDGLEPDTDTPSSPPHCVDESEDHPPDVRTPLIKEWDARARRWTITAEGDLVDKEYNRTTVDGWAAGLAWPAKPAPAKARSPLTIFLIAWLASPVLVLLLGLAAAHGSDHSVVAAVVLAALGLGSMIGFFAGNSGKRKPINASGPILFRPEGFPIVNKTAAAAGDCPP